MMMVFERVAEPLQKTNQRNLACAKLAASQVIGQTIVPNTRSHDPGLFTSKLVCDSKNALPLPEGSLGSHENQPNVTDKEISYIMRRDINRITPRQGELLALGLVEEVGKRKCRVTGRTANCVEGGADAN